MSRLKIKNNNEWIFIPASGTGSGVTNPLYNMFDGTGGTSTINTTYYTSNEIVY